MGPGLFSGAIAVSFRQHFLTPKLEGNVFLKRLGPTSGNFTNHNMFFVGDVLDRCDYVALQSLSLTRSGKSMVPIFHPRLAKLRLGIEKNPLIQCASRLGEQDELMLEALFRR